MKIKVHTLATDTDMGTSSGAFATEEQMWDSLIQGTGSYLSDHTRADADAWLAEQGDPDLTYHDWWEAHRGDLDSYTCDEIAVDVPLCGQPLPATGREQVAEAIECLQRARYLLKASGNKQTLARVRLALSSAKGAARIQCGRETRARLAEATRLRADARALDTGMDPELVRELRGHADAIDPAGKEG